MELQLTTAIGTGYWHKWSDGSLTEITENDYHALASSGSPTPPEGLTWVCSFSGQKYDTPSGHLENGFYCDAGDCFLAQLEGCNAVYVDKSKIISNVLDETVYNEIIADSGNLNKIYG